MYKKLAITTILFLLLSITVSFAWMMDVIGPSGDVITFDFTDSVFVEPNNLVIDISVEKDGEYVSACNNTFEENSLVQFNNCAPGDILKFSVKLTNLTDLAISTSILFSDITSSNEDFYNYISIGVFSTNGFDNMYKAPEFSDFKIISKMKKDDNGNILPFYDWEESTISVSFETRIDKGIKLTSMPIPDPENYVCMFVIYDAQGNVTASELIPLS